MLYCYGERVDLINAYYNKKQKTVKNWFSHQDVQRYVNVHTHTVIGYLLC